MNVVVTNSKTKGTTKENAETCVRVTAHQAVFRSSAYALASFKQIAHTLLEVEIRRCNLTNASLLAQCVNARTVCLAENGITSIPKTLQELNCLQILDFSHNELSDLKAVSNIRLAPCSLTYLSLVGNPVALEKHYRRNIIMLAPSLSALDYHVFTDADMISYMSYFTRFDALHHKPNMVVDKILHTIQLKDTVDLTEQHVNVKCALIKNIRTLASAAFTIQKQFRKWIKVTTDHEQCENFVEAIVKLQAIVRSFLFSRKLKREIDSLISNESITVTLTQTIERVNQLDSRTRQIQKWARSCLRYRRDCRASLYIQRWFRRAIVYHRGILRWIKRLGITGIIFTQPFLRLVKQRLSAYPSTFVKAQHMRSLVEDVRLFGHRLISVRPGDRYIFFRNGTLKRVSAPSTSPPVLSRVSLFSLSYSSDSQRKRCQLLKRRGVHYRTRCYNERSRQTPGCQHVREEFISNSHRVFRIGIENPTELLKVFKYLQRGDPGLSVYFDQPVVRDACATDIQRVWRSFLLRKLIAPMFLTSVITRRALIGVQRWWRNINNFQRRFKLLRSCNLQCRSITSHVVYMDAWVYYHLLRCYSRPSNQLDVMSKFPEFKGIPIFDDNGRIAIQPCMLHRKLKEGKDKITEMPTSTGRAIEIPVVRVHSEGKARMCIPRWASWRPQHQLPSINKPLLSHHVVLFSLLTLHCDVAVKAFNVPFKKSHNLKKVREIRVVELKFASAFDAQTRCAMLMLLTYDPLSHSSISMMPEEEIQRRLREKSDIIINERGLLEDAGTVVDVKNLGDDRPLLKNDDDQELCPIETKVLLSPTSPDWLVDMSQKVSSAEVIRFQFMCECLAAKEVRRSESINIVNEPQYCDVISDNGVRHGDSKPTTFVPLQSYGNCDTSYGVSHKFTMANIETEVFPAAYTQQLLPVPKPLLTPQRPRSAAPPPTPERRNPIIDFRFRGKLWTKERVLLWCSNFHDTAPETVLMPKRPTTTRPLSARESSHRYNNNACSAVEGRLQMVTLSTTAKTMGKFRVDSIPKPQEKPHRMHRNEFISEQANKRKKDVQELLWEKRVRSEKRTQSIEYEQSCKREQVRQVQSEKSTAAGKCAEWRTVKSASAKTQVSESLAAARQSTALYLKATEEEKSARVRQVKLVETSAKIANEKRQKALRATCTLNAIASRMAKKDHKRMLSSKTALKKQAHSNNTKRNDVLHARHDSASQAASPSRRKVKQHHKQEPRRFRYASCIKDLLVTRFEPRKSPPPNTTCFDEVSDAAHSLSLRSQSDFDEDENEDDMIDDGDFMQKYNRTKGHQHVEIMTKRDLLNISNMKQKITDLAFDDCQSLKSEATRLAHAAGCR